MSKLGRPKGSLCSKPVTGSHAPAVRRLHRRGWTQSHIGRRLGISRQAVHQLIAYWRLRPWWAA